jgi:hypothetical protein
VTPALWTLAFVATMYALGTLAYFCARRSSYHTGKAEVYRELANTWGGIRDVAWMRDKRRQRAARQAQFLRMALIAPEVCEALEAALVDAREHWKHQPIPAESATTRGVS